MVGKAQAERGGGGGEASRVGQWSPVRVGRGEQLQGRLEHDPMVQIK